MNAAVLGYYKTLETMIIPLLYICIQVKMVRAGIMINGDVVRGSTFSQERYLSFRNMIIKISYKL